MQPAHGRSATRSWASFERLASVQAELREDLRRLGVLLRPNAAGLLCRRFSALHVLRPARRLADARPHNAVILVYHRIAAPGSDPQLLNVTPEHFAEHLKVIQEEYRAISLRDLTLRLAARKPVRGTVSVTLDDGYADNLYEAKPLLQRHAVPATVFIASAYIGHGRSFWWDELQRLLLEVGTIPRTLQLEINGRLCSWHLGDDARYEPCAYERDRGWHVGAHTTPTRRHRLYKSLYRLLHGLLPPQRDRIIGELRAWANRDQPDLAAHRTLTNREVAALAADNLVEIGAHTVSHPVLSMLPLPEQQREIEASKQHLEQITGQRVRSFAYPYGSLSDYSGATKKVIQALGFACACSTFADTVRRGYDPYQLPRFLVRDWDADTFARRLRDWMLH